MSGQGVPQYAPRLDSRLPSQAVAPVPAVPYDPATGDYIGPDGKRYTQAELAHPGDKTWQSMRVPTTP
jgi:phospholipid/cholesterol/gamma-HCH transport system substrate-binding protein